MFPVPLYQRFFWSGALFLLGVVFATATFGTSYVFFSALAMTVGVGWCIVRRDRRFLPLVFFFFIGALYFYLYHGVDSAQRIAARQKISFTSTVEKSDATFRGQEVVVRTDDGRMLKLYTLREPRYLPGDQLRVVGTAAPSRSPFVHGTVSFPTIERVGRVQGFSFLGFMRWLAVLKEHFQDNLKRMLPYQEAVFASGLTVGGRSGFSLEMEEVFKVSGTSHLVALSGFNIAIIVSYMSALAGVLFSRRGAFWLTLSAVLGFVLLAGAEASLVRAAIMGVIIVVADRAGRQVYLPNALMLAALIMIVYDPRLLVFDVGFQLSFAALIGIVYLKPYLECWVPQPFFGKREVLTTIAAEVAVMPIVVGVFGSFSPWGLLANPLIALFIPLTMGLSFLTGAVGFVSTQASLLFAVPAHILLGYELAVVHWFAGVL